MFPTCIFNAILRLKYWPKSLKTIEIIFIPKSRINSVSTYRLINLLSIIFSVAIKLRFVSLLDWCLEHANKQIILKDESRSGGFLSMIESRETGVLSIMFKIFRISFDVYLIWAIPGNCYSNVSHKWWVGLILWSLLPK